MKWGSPLFCVKSNGNFGLAGIAFENQNPSMTKGTITLFTNVNKWRRSFINKVLSGKNTSQTFTNFHKLLKNNNFMLWTQMDMSVHPFVSYVSTP